MGLEALFYLAYFSVWTYAKLVIAALGAFVHPLRLTFVEFYKAVGFTGGNRIPLLQ